MRKAGWGQISLQRGAEEEPGLALGLSCAFYGTNKVFKQWGEGFETLGEGECLCPSPSSSAFPAHWGNNLSSVFFPVIGQETKH